MVLGVLEPANRSLAALLIRHIGQAPQHRDTKTPLSKCTSGFAASSLVGSTPQNNIAAPRITLPPSFAFVKSVFIIGSHSPFFCFVRCTPFAQLACRVLVSHDAVHWLPATLAQLVSCGLNPLRYILGICCHVSPLKYRYVDVVAGFDELALQIEYWGCHTLRIFKYLPPLVDVNKITHVFAHRHAIHGDLNRELSLQP